MQKRAERKRKEEKQRNEELEKQIVNEENSQWKFKQLLAKKRENHRYLRLETKKRFRFICILLGKENEIFSKTFILLYVIVVVVFLNNTLKLFMGFHLRQAE